MRFSEVIQLVPVVTTTDELKQTITADGDPVSVYCNPYSISRAEFDVAGQQGMRPDSAFQLNSIDYHDEQKAVVNGKTLHVYRTSINGDRTVIYLTERVSDGG